VLDMTVGVSDCAYIQTGAATARIIEAIFPISVCFWFGEEIVCTGKFLWVEINNLLKQTIEMEENLGTDRLIPLQNYSTKW
jgi:hypothetical protein